MIKVNRISEKNKMDFYNDNVQRLKECLINLEKLYIQKGKKSLVLDALLVYLDYNNGVFSEEKLKDLLIGDKKKLINIIQKVENFTINNKICNESSDYALYHEFEDLYKKFTNRILGKSWAKNIGVSICPYCNRLFTDTIEDGGVRPQYDHYFPKSKYPYLSISMYNLVPCCSLCNSKKGSTDTYLNSFIYPFEDEYGYNIYFKVKEGSDIFSNIGLMEKEDIKLEIICNNVNLRDTVDNTNARLKIVELYENRSEYINRLLFLKYNIYVEDYINSLKSLNGFNQLDSSTLDFLIYGKYLEKDNWDKDILSKLAHDIIKLD